MTGEEVMSLEPGTRIVLTAPYPGQPFKPDIPVGTVATVIRPDLLGGFRSNRKRLDGMHPCLRVRWANGESGVVMPEYAKIAD